MGSVGLPGSAGLFGTTFSISASGADIWDSADAFHFVYQPLTGDVEIIARVGSLQNVDPWAKAGVMIRESLTAGARHAMVLVTPGNGTAFQRRINSGGLTTGTPGPAVTAPYWLRLVRSGDIFSSYVSATGTTWTLIGADTIAMPASVYVGIPVTAHNNTLLTTATLDNVALSGGVTPTTVTTSSSTTSTSTSTSTTSSSTATSTSSSATTITSTTTSTTLPPCSTSCDDGDACTTDTCDPPGGCVNTPLPSTDLASVACSVANLSASLNATSMCTANCPRTVARRLTRTNDFLLTAHQAATPLGCRHRLLAGARVARKLARQLEGLMLRGRVTPPAAATQVAAAVKGLRARIAPLPGSYCAPH